MGRTDGVARSVRTAGAQAAAIGYSCAPAFGYDDAEPCAVVAHRGSPCWWLVGQAVGRRPSRPPRPKRWGLRTLVFLGITAASIMISNFLHAKGNDNFVLLTFIGTVVGLVGATVCSVRGIQAMGGRLPRS
jgi:hypothetical protein